MKFELKSIDSDNVTSTREFECISWVKALDEFITFLKGSGYSFKENYVEVHFEYPEYLPEDYLFNIKLSKLETLKTSENQEELI